MAQFRPAAYALGPLTVRWNRRVHEASPTIQEQTAAGQRALRLIADGFVLHDEIIFHFTDASPNTTAYRYWCGVSAMDLHVGSCWLRPTSHAFVLQDTHAQPGYYGNAYTGMTIMSMRVRVGLQKGGARGCDVEV